jgi:tetratricopeptide (TPR) repeat protein
MAIKLTLLFASALTLSGVQERPTARPYQPQPAGPIQQTTRDSTQQEKTRSDEQQVVTSQDSAEGYFELGESYRNGGAGKVELAVEAYKRAILLRPDYSYAYKGLAWCYGQLRDHKKQIEALQHAITLDPSDAEAFCQLGDAMRAQDFAGRENPVLSWEEVMSSIEASRKKAEAALELYKQAIRLRPGYALAYNGLGSAYLVLERRSEAIEAYHHAIENDPDNPLFRIGLGYVFLHFEEYDAALEQHRVAMSLIENRQPETRGVYEIGAGMLLNRIRERRRKQ